MHSSRDYVVILHLLICICEHRQDCLKALLGALVQVVLNQATLGPVVSFLNLLAQTYPNNLFLYSLHYCDPEKYDIYKTCLAKQVHGVECTVRFCAPLRLFSPAQS
jgi:hypothetical protein